MRLEPDVDFYCELDYDIFEYMERNGKRYGFNMIMKEIPETVPSLWWVKLPDLSTCGGLTDRLITQASEPAFCKVPQD